MVYSDLKRFIEAQKKDFEIALSEIKSGRKRSHWMWYIFPQFKGLGSSETSQYYSIKSLDEAKEYLNHPTLGERLKQISSELLNLKENDPKLIFGSPDYMKLHSSMTLFSYVTHSDHDIFRSVIEKFFQGEFDKKTVDLITRDDENR